MSGYDVLVVDDESDVCAYLQAILQEEGLSVKCAPNGMEALSLLRQEKPQLIVLDLMMPEMSGDQLCRIIKEDPTLKNIIVFMLSAKADLESKLACFQSGAEEYIVKPVDSRELTARVGRFIKLVDELKAPSQDTLEGQKVEPPQKTPAAEAGDLEIPSLALEDYSFLRFQSTYGNYRVESLVGKGGMGQVFKAKDEQLERDVAVKVLAPKLMSTPEFVERFRREAKVLASINHPGIASIYSFSEQKGEYYFAMQWCSGGSLSEMIRKNGSIETLMGIDIILQCAHALSAAQKKGVVHRDIKPSNLMFDENQLIKVVDFGLAFAETINTNLTHGGEFLGTPSYMAPEQAKSPSVDHRADIYSLGITFYHMLYGRLPFQAGTSIEMVIKHTSHPFPAFDDRGGRISRSAYSIVEKMTQKEPATRYQDYASLIKDLEEARNELLHQSRLKVPMAARIAPVAAITSNLFYELLATVFTQNQTGVITCRWNALEKHFLVRNREIIYFESLQPDESIWVYMVRKGILKKEDLPANKGEVEQPLNRFLLNNAFTMEEFKKSYRELLLSALNQVFLWPVFEGAFATSTIENDAFCMIPLADFLLTASRSVLDIHQIRQQMPVGRALKRTFQFDFVLRTLNLSPEESFIASRFEGENITIETLNFLTSLPEERIVRAIYALEKLGAIQYKIPPERLGPPQRKPDNPPQHIPPPPAFQPKMNPVVERRSDIERTQVPTPQTPAPQQESKQQTKSSPSLAKSSPSLGKSSPSLGNSSPSLGKSSPSLGKSSPSLKSDTSPSQDYWMEMQRKRFLAPNPPTPTPLSNPSNAGESMVRMEVRKSEKMMEVEHHVKVAEQFYQIAERKFEDGDFYNVTSLCKQAIANNPTEAKYYLLMAKAYAQHPRFLKDAESSYQKAIELDPWNPDSHVELAQFYYGQGLSLRAMNECKKALSITATHQGAQELLKELKSKDK